MFAAASDATLANAEGSLRTAGHPLEAERATLGQLIEHVRREKMTIEVANESSNEVQAILKESISLNEVSEKLPGTKFFPLIFGKHFKRVDVKDDRVGLSLD